jgi:hypothetical protein
MRFTERCEFRGDPAEVWRRVSDIENIPLYWHGTRKLTASKEAGRTVADVVFAFGGKGRAVISADDASKTLVIDYVKGPLRGPQTIRVSETAVEAEWSVEFTGAYRIVGPLNESHFRSGTRNALQRLATGSST